MKSPPLLATLAQAIPGFILDSASIASFIKEIEIIWPSHTRQVMRNVAADRIVTIEEPRQ